MGQSNFKPRKATFTVTGEKSGRIFTPVNRRAKIVARKLGKRTRITTADMRRAKSMGSYKLCVATGTGENRKLRAIRV
jgi:hypothetical protein